MWTADPWRRPYDGSNGVSIATSSDGQTAGSAVLETAVAVYVCGARRRRGGRGRRRRRGGSS